MATQEQWEVMKEWAEHMSPIGATLLELRARIEALEEDAKSRSHCDMLLFRSVIKRLENLEEAQNFRQQDEDTERAWTPAPQTPEQVSAGLREAFRKSQGTSNDCQIRSSLVESVAYALTGDSDGPYYWKPEARAAIRGVADWLQQRTDTIANGSQWADLLREEAGR